MEWYTKISGADLEDMGILVANAAHDLFCKLEIEQDFCIQHISASSVVFGGSNRILWNPADGFILDRPYCSPLVIEKWEDMQ